jgi:hypothetical protein
VHAVGRAASAASAQTPQQAHDLLLLKM